MTRHHVNSGLKVFGDEGTVYAKLQQMSAVHMSSKETIVQMLYNT